MAVEIELKVRLDDPDPVKERLSGIGTYHRAYEKNDTYWYGQGNLPPSGVRVRIETDTDSEDKRGESVLVTYKTKELRGGIEINDEREFAIAGTGGAAVFEELLDRLGLRPGIRKQKRGFAWSIPGDGSAPVVLAELSMVPGLGWFLELEILAEDREERTTAEGRERLLALLDTLDIPRERIESRPYTEMLLARRGEKETYEVCVTLSN